MNLQRIVTDDQYNAGCLFAVVVGGYRSVIEGPQSTAGNGSGGLGCPSQYGEASEKTVRLGAVKFIVREWPCQRDGQACACAVAKGRYDGAFEALMSAGQRAAKAVARVAVHHEALAREDLVYLKAGLNALARHFGLTRRQH